MKLWAAGSMLASGLALGVANQHAVLPPGHPTVRGPRDTTLEQPVYVFRARGAVGFRCAFDNTILHRCARRYSEPLLPGSHTLRVRAVGRSGSLSRAAAVRLRVRLPVPKLTVDYTVPIGAGAGLPAPDGISTWVPVTSTGTLVRVNQPNGAIVSRADVGAPTGSQSALDSAYADSRQSVYRDIWYASDAGGRVVRLDHSTGAVTATVDVGARPGEMTSEPSGLHGATIWSFHRLSGKVTRIDAQSTSASSVDLPGVTATGLALEGNSLWMLSTNPDRIVELDDQTLQMKRSIDLRPPFAHRPSSVDTGSLVGGEQGLWAVLPGYRAIALVDTTTGTVRYYHVPYGTPSSLAVGAGFLWVATNHAVLQFDEKTVSLKAAAIVPSAPRTGIMSIAFGYAAAWVANYDRGTLARVPLPVP